MSASTSAGGAMKPTGGMAFMGSIEEDVEMELANDGEPSSISDLNPAEMRAWEHACRDNALAAEQVAVRAMEAAMIARTTADAQSAALDKARVEAHAAAQKAARAVTASEKADAGSKAAAVAAEEARMAVLPVNKSRLEAEEIVTNGAKAEAMAAEKVFEAKTEEKAASVAAVAAEKVAQSKMEAATIESQAVKLSKKDAEKMVAQAAESAQNTKLCAETISEAQAVLEEKQREAQEAAKKAHTLREELEDKQQAQEAALRAAEEAVGGDASWEAKTAERLKARELDLKRATTVSTKATRAESIAEAAEYDADQKLKQAKEDQATRASEAEKDDKASRDASAQVQKQTRSSEAAQQAHAVAEKSLTDARAFVAAMSMKVEEAERAQEDAAPERAEKAAHKAREEEAKAKKYEKEMMAAAAAKRQALAAAIAEQEAAAATAETKNELAEAAAAKDYVAVEKEQHTDALVEELKTKVQLLALAKLRTRGIQMSMNQAADSFEGARHARETAINWNKPPNDISVVDKWTGWRRRRDEGGVWNPRRLFFANDATIISTIDIMVSDIVGSALDLGPICARRCKIYGEGVAQASIGHVSTFSIAAFNVEGKPFDEGGGTFTVNVRFAGMGTRVNSKVRRVRARYAITTGRMCVVTPEPFAACVQVVDNEDGTYAISYKPMSSGKCTVSITYGGEHVASSPYICTVSAPTPCATQCEVSGEALTSAVVHRPENFYLTFRDAHGQLAHACELDVWVEPVGANSGQVPGGMEHLLQPLGAFESFAVGPVTLDVTRSQDVDSHKIGRLLPGRVLKVLKMEPLASDGTLRACVALEPEDRQPKSDNATWRELWPSQQDWRTPSWRAHIEEVRETEEAKVAEIAMRIEMTRHNAASALQSAFRGQEGRRYVVQYRIQRKVEADAKAAAAAAKAAKADKKGKMPSIGGKGAARKEKEAAAAQSPAMKPKNPAPADKAAAKGQPAAKSPQPKGSPPTSPSAPSTPTLPAAGSTVAKSPAPPAAIAAAVAPAPEVDKSEGAKGEGAKGEGAKGEGAKGEGVKGEGTKGEGAKSKPSPKPRRPDGAKAKAKASTVSDEPGVGDAEAIVKHTAAAIKVQAAIRGLLVRHKIAKDKATAAMVLEPKADDEPKPKPKPKSPGRKKKQVKKTPEQLAAEEALAKAAEEAQAAAAARAEKEEAEARAAAVRAAEVAAVRSAMADIERKRQEHEQVANATSARSSLQQSPGRRAGSPRLRIKLKLDCGWISLAQGGETLVTRQTGRLPAHLRQQHLQQWSRRVAIDSERERNRALIRDRENEDEKMKLASGSARETLHSRPPVVASAYKRDVETDPTGIGFAYGGLYPGRLHAKGQLIEKHEVHFSVAKCGNYLLYVSLHGQSQHGGHGNCRVPGSPFMLSVAPGRAHPLTTQIPPSVLPLRAAPVVDEEKEQEREKEQQLLQQQLTMASLPSSNGPPPPIVADRYVCEFSLQARDKMGNPCSSGGAAITCGFLEAPSSLEDVSALQPSNDATCTDIDDGTYRLQWSCDAPGAFTIFVKIDGLHVLGSPTRLVAPAVVRTQAVDQGVKAPPNPGRRRDSISRQRAEREVRASQESVTSSIAYDVRMQREMRASQESVTSSIAYDARMRFSHETVDSSSVS